MYLSGIAVIIILGFTVLLVIPFAFTLLLGVWSVTIVYFAPLRDIGNEILVDSDKMSRDDVLLLATLNTAEAYLADLIQKAQGKLDDEKLAYRMKQAATYEVQEAEKQLAQVSQACMAECLAVRTPSLPALRSVVVFTTHVLTSQVKAARDAAILRIRAKAMRSGAQSVDEVAANIAQSGRDASPSRGRDASPSRMLIQ